MADSIDLTSIGTLKAATSYTSTSLYDAVKLRIGKQGLAASPAQTIPQFFRERCRQFADLPALVFQKSTNNDAEFTTLTYADFERQVEQSALLMLHVGLQARSSVGILAFNCPEWFYAQMGALRAGGVVAGIYPSSSAEAVFHVLDTSDATVCVVDDAQQMAKVRAVKSRLPRLHAVLQVHGPYEDFVGVDEGYYRWEDLAGMQFGDELKAELERREREVYANECALLIYTSGTVGMPKGVMLSHDSVIFDAKAVTQVIPNVEYGGETTVTYLPLNHIAAQVFDIFMNIESGGCIYFADRNALKGTLMKTLTMARPRRLFGVPRIFEKIQEKLQSVEANATGLTKLIMTKSRRTMENYYLDLYAGKSPSQLRYWFAAMVTRQIKVALGLERCKSFFVGGAPVSEELKRFFLSLDMPLTDVYGLSEASGGVTLNIDGCNLQSVGKALESIEIKIFNPNSEGHGEICLRGRTCLMGYLNEPDKTKETLRDDGWLHTGDIGYLDTQSNLIVSGRLKELIITAGGENIPPIRIEQLVKLELPFVSNAILIGERRKYLSMLLTIKTDISPETGYPLDLLQSEAVEWLSALDLNFKRLSEVLQIPADLKNLDASNVVVKPHPQVLQSIQEGIERVNAHAISNAQRIQKFVILPHDFSIPTGELGPTLKVRRNIVVQKYANIIDEMYKQPKA